MLKRILIVLVAVFALSAVSFGQASPKPKPGKHTAKVVKTAPKVVRCPVLGEKVVNIKKATHSTYKGKTYYFCCPSCKAKFDKSPAKYIANSAKGKYDKM